MIWPTKEMPSQQLASISNHTDGNCNSSFLGDANSTSVSLATSNVLDGRGLSEQCSLSRLVENEPNSLSRLAAKCDSRTAASSVVVSCDCWRLPLRGHFHSFGPHVADEGSATGSTGLTGMKATRATTLTLSRSLTEVLPAPQTCGATLLSAHQHAHVYDQRSWFSFVAEFLTKPVEGLFS